jgi:radical SAM protein with 4Fe4S-binding SPASM domain
MHLLEVEITTRCNLDCKHCYNRNYQKIDLPVEKFKELYHFANEHGVWSFIISGGEALLSPYFDEIAFFIKNTPHKFRLVLQSNGLLLTDDKIIEKIKIFDLIHISYDITEDVREKGNRNLETARKLLDKGIKCYLFATVHKKNRRLIEEMASRANDLDIPIGFNICVPAEHLDDSFLMSKEEFMETEKKLFSLYKNGKILRYSSPLIALLDESKKGDWQGIKGGCSAGIASCIVSPAGELYPCPFFRTSAGNIFNDSLEKLWLASELFAQLRERRKIKDPCGSCEYLSYCGGCRKRAFKSFGDLQSVDPMCYKNLLEK